MSISKITRSAPLVATALILVAIAMAHLRLPASSIDPHDANREIVADAAGRFDLPVGLLLAVAEVESGFNATARSAEGAVGLLQVMPETAAVVATRLEVRNWDLENPHDNALIGAAHLAELLRRYRGDRHLALAAYHAGSGRVDGWVARGGGLPGPEVIEQFAFEETRTYVGRVLAKNARR